MHILFIPAWFESPNHPTSGKAVKDLAIALTRSGLQVNILFQSKFRLPDVQQLEEGVLLFHSKYDLGGKLIPILNLISLKRYLDSFKRYIVQKGLPDAIHIHGYNGMAIGQCIHQKYKIPLVYTEHSSRIVQHKLGKIEQYLIRKYAESYKKIVAVSQYLASDLQEVVKSAVVTIPNTIDFSFFTPGQKINQDQWIMINLLNKNKQVDLGIQAFHKYSLNRQGAILHIIGDGDERAALKKLAIKLGIENKVVFHGESKMYEWIHVLQSSSGLLILSQSETFGVVALEALACKIPVISLDNGGIREIASSDDIQLLSLHATSEDIAHAMHALVSKPTQWNDLREKLKSKFDFDVVAGMYINLYNQLRTNAV